MITGCQRYSFSFSRTTQWEETVGSQSNGGREKKTLCEKKLFNTDVAYMCARISPDETRRQSCYRNFASMFEYVTKRKGNSERSETLIKCETSKKWLHVPTSPAENTHRCLQIMQQASTKMSANALNKRLDNTTSVTVYEHETLIETQKKLSNDNNRPQRINVSFTELDKTRRKRWAC